MVNKIAPFQTQGYIDIWDHIFSFLHDDAVSLKSCSLVWSGWLPLVYHYLHHRLRLPASCSHHRVGKRAASVDTTIPFRITSYVRELTLEFNCWCRESPVPSWAAHLPSIRCQRLKLVRIRWTMWTCLPKETRLQLASFLEAQSFQTLSLSQCRFPSSISLRRDLRCVGITELRLDGVDFDHAKNVDLDEEITDLDRKNHLVPELSNLKVAKICLWSSDASSATVQWALRSLSHSDLQTLELYWNVYEHGIPLLTPLFSSLQALRHLKLMHSTCTEKLLGELYDIPSLQTLHILGCYEVFSFRALKPPPTLHEIYVDLILQNRNTRSDFVSKHSISLNEEMNNSTAFSSITKVLCRLSVLNEAEWLHISGIPKANSSMSGIRQVVDVIPHISFSSKESGLYAASPTYVISRQVDN